MGRQGLDLGVRKEGQGSAKQRRKWIKFGDALATKNNGQRKADAGRHRKKW